MLSKGMKCGLNNEDFIMSSQNNDTEVFIEARDMPHFGLVVNCDGTDEDLANQFGRLKDCWTPDEVASKWIAHLARTHKIGYCFDVRKVLDEAELFRELLGDIDSIVLNPGLFQETGSEVEESATTAGASDQKALEDIATRLGEISTQISDASGTIASAIYGAAGQEY